MESVDKKERKIYGNPKNEEDSKIIDSLRSGGKNLCKQKNPHPKVEVFPNLNVDNVDNLFAEKMFADIHNVSGTHSYQQVTVHTIF